MGRIYYAKLKDNICISITTDVLESDEYIELEGEDIRQVSELYLGKKYKDGKWEEVDPMYFYQPLSDQEAATFQIQSDLEYLICLKELGL